MVAIKIIGGHDGRTQINRDPCGRNPKQVRASQPQWESIATSMGAMGITVIATMMVAITNHCDHNRRNKKCDPKWSISTSIAAMVVPPANHSAQQGCHWKQLQQCRQLPPRGPFAVDCTCTVSPAQADRSSHSHPRPTFALPALDRRTSVPPHPLTLLHGTREKTKTSVPSCGRST